MKTIRKKISAAAAALVAAVFVSTPAIAKADVVLDWNAIAISAAVTNPFNQARVMATTQLAVFEAVNAIERGYEPYLGTVVAPAGASSDAAVIAAASRVLRESLPGSVGMVDAARASSLAAIPDGPAKTSGIAVGEAAAAAMLANRLNDGSTVAEFHLPASTDPGVWQLTPSCPAAGSGFLHWGNLMTFGVANAADFLAAPPPAMTGGRYAKDFEEVKRVGGKTSPDRPQDRTDVALFYAASSPAYVFNLAARQMATQQNRSRADNARSLALINMAISDAFVASFATKYHYALWRPETAIHGAEFDGNPRTEADPDWQPLVAAPCFPSYVSNHASGSNSAAEMLRRLYGPAGHVITLTHPAFPALVYHYSQLKQITADIDDARVYGGIHFRFDQEGGATLAREVATAVYKNNLRPVPGGN